MVKKITYDGNNLMNVSFGLYNIELTDSLEFDEIKNRILEEFKEQYESRLKAVFKKMGMKLVGFNYYSPHAYNFQTDSIDFILVVEDKKRLQRLILKYKKEIDSYLDKNKSYDGYMATTVDSVDNELLKLKESGYKPDVIVLAVLMKKLGFSITNEDVIGIIENYLGDIE